MALWMGVGRDGRDHNRLIEPIDSGSEKVYKAPKFFVGGEGDFELAAFGGAADINGGAELLAQLSWFRASPSKRVRGSF